MLETKSDSYMFSHIKRFFSNDRQKKVLNECYDQRKIYFIKVRFRRKNDEEQKFIHERTSRFSIPVHAAYAHFEPSGFSV